MKPPSANPRKLSSRAFSLIELMAVLIILGLIAGVVAVSVKGKDGRMRMEDVSGELRQFERQTREHARTFRRPTQLVFDLRSGKVRRVDAQGQRPQTAPMQLPRGFRLAEVKLADRSVRDGEVGLPCSSLGMTATYAVLLEGPQKQKQWFVFGGLTGEVNLPDQGDAIEKAFQQLNPPEVPGGPHAH